MTNPTVPTNNQKDMIVASAPDAKSVNVPDASDNSGKNSNQTQHVGNVDRVDSSKSKNADQGTTPAVDLSKTSGKDHFAQQEKNARQFEKNVGEDSFRKAARLEREAQDAAAEGDPTRDPVAKQAAMDMNTPLPGAKQDAQKIKNIGEKEADKQAKRDGTK